MQGPMVLLQLFLLTWMFHDAAGADPVWVSPDAMSNTASVDENVGAGTSVFTIDATDADMDMLTYSIGTQTPTSPAFTLSGTELQAPAGLDAEGTASFTIDFDVNDGMSGAITSVVLTVTVNDLSDVDPVFGQASYTATIPNSAANGDTVVTVTATPDVIGGTITYVIAGGNMPATFAINSGTGEITVSDEMNVDHGTTPSYTLSVEAGDGTRTGTVAVTVTINEPPVFTTPMSPDTATIDENSVAGTTVYTVAATDGDMGDTITYSLVSQNPAAPAFSFSGADLQAPAMLDADGGTTSYDFVFGASDTKDTVNSAIVTVTVNDLADEDPVFGAASYSTSITDTAATGDTVLTVVATADTSGTTITYTLASGNMPDTFELDSMTGEMTVKNDANVDSGTTPSYTLSVEADDGTRTATVVVTIIVNAPPVFTTPMSADTANIDENSVAGTSVYTVLATDADMADTITYSIVSQNPATPAFTISGAELQAPAMLDADSGTTSYDFVFGASDTKDTVSSSVVTVTVNDLADEDPVFGAAMYSEIIPDNAATGDTVLTVVATADTSGATITYTLASGNMPDTFELDSMTGVITVKNDANVDSGTTPSYTLSVEADDGTLTATVAVAITVNALPVFTTPVSADTANIDENSSAGTSVYTVAATDADMGDTITYGIFSQNPVTPAFTMSGAELQAPAMLDADGGTTSFDIVFNASDAKVTVNSAVVTVTVNDLADEDPVFGAASYSETITDNAATGDSVLTVAATADTSGQTISYTLASGNTPDTFALDSGTGLLTVSNAANLDHGTTPSYTLSVEADDGTRTATVAATITVNAHNSAKRTSSFFTFWLAEVIFVICLLRAMY